MAQYTITISVDFTDCSFTYSATQLKARKKTRVRGHKLHVHTNDKVSWTCADGNFCGLFKSDSPLDVAGFAGLVGDTAGPFKVTARHNSGGNNTYSYFVAAINPLDGSTCTDDPDIIIDP